MALNYLNSLNSVRYIHQSMDNIDNVYKNKSLHIALEYADINKDWKTFKILYRLAPGVLLNHLNNTKFVLEYNYLNLGEQERNDLFQV
jgi:hypothetical protein